jgi:hypothetical protein
MATSHVSILRFSAAKNALKSGSAAASVRQRLEEANTEVKDGQPDMDLAAFLTFHFVVMLDPEEVMTLDREIPGFRDALIAYLIGIDFC